MIDNNILKYKIISNNISLDLFNDEPIKISNNITELFDIGTLPNDIINDISIPGSKINNEFFKHYYDLSIDNIDSYTTNKKISCYLDINNIFIIPGYLMLNYVTVDNNYIDSYNITIYGTLNLLGSIIKQKYLSDLITLNTYNHNLTLNNITNSWDYKLFNGDIIYPLADYGQKIYYTSSKDGYGIDEQDGALSVQDFKPAIKVKKIFDAIFNEAGYTYESNFLNYSGYLENCYFLLNKYKKYPIIENYDLEDYGKIKISPPKSVLNKDMTYNVNYKLPYFSISENIGGRITFTKPNTLKYKIDKSTILKGSINLNFTVTNKGNGKGMPQFQLIFKNDTNTYSTPLKKINYYMVQVSIALSSQNVNTPTQEYTLLCEFNTPYMVPGEYEIYLKYTRYGTDTNYSIKIDTSSSPESYLIIEKQLNLGDNEEIIITNQFAEMTQLDFIKSIQKKFNLIIYSSKTKINHFIIETFNDWYKRNNVKNFNSFIDIGSKIKVTPANNLAYKTLTFKDKLDKDYISKTFNDEANREYAMQTYTDINNNYSTDEFVVETQFASSPLVRIDNNEESGIDTLEKYVLEISSKHYPKGNGTDADLSSTLITIKIYSEYEIPYYNNGSDFKVNIKLLVTSYTEDEEIISINIPNGQSVVYTKVWGGVEYLPMVNYYDIIPVCVNSLPSNVTLKSTSQLQMCF